MAESEQTSVGDLVVDLTGNSDLAKQVQDTITWIEKLDVAVRNVGVTIDSVNARPLLPELKQIVTRKFVSQPVPPIPPEVSQPHVATAVLPQTVPVTKQTGSSDSYAGLNTGSSVVQITAEQFRAAEDRAHVSVMEQQKQRGIEFAKQAQEAAEKVSTVVRNPNPLGRDAAPAKWMTDWKPSVPKQPITVPVIPKVETIKIEKPIEVPVRPVFARTTKINPFISDFPDRDRTISRPKAPPSENDSEKGLGMRGSGILTSQLASMAGVPELGHAIHLTQIIKQSMEDMGVAKAAAFAIPLGVLIAAGAIVGNIYEEYRRLREVTIAYNLELDKSVRHLSQISLGVLDTSDLGKQLANEIEAGIEESINRIEEFKKKQRLLGPFDRLTQTIDFQVRGDNSNVIQEVKEIDRENRNQAAILQQQIVARNKARDTTEVHDLVKQGFERRSAAIESMPEGPQKRGMLLENSIQSGRSELLEKQFLAQTELQTRQDQKMLTLQLKGHYDEKAALEENNREIEALARQHNSQLLTFEAVSDSKRAGETSRVNEEMLAQAAEFHQALVAADTFGYARELAQLRESNRDKEMENKRTRRLDPTTLRETNLAKETALIAEHNNQIFESHKDLEDRLSLASLAAPKMDLEWEKMSRNMIRNLGYTKTQVEEFHQLFIRVSQAEADKPLLAGILDSNIQLEVALHRITDVEASIRRMREAAIQQGLVPNENLIRDKANKEQMVKSAEWAREQLAQLSNPKGMRIQLENYAREIRAAVKSGQLSIPDAQLLYAKKTREVGGFLNEGMSQSVGAGGNFVGTNALSRLRLDFMDMRVPLIQPGKLDLSKDMPSTENGDNPINPMGTGATSESVGKTDPNTALFQRMILLLSDIAAKEPLR